MNMRPRYGVTLSEAPLWTPETTHKMLLHLIPPSVV